MKIPEMILLKHFAVKLKLEEETVSKARATSKKKAEEIAAKRAYYKLKKKNRQLKSLIIKNKIFNKNC